MKEGPIRKYITKKAEYDGLYFTFNKIYILKHLFQVNTNVFQKIRKIQLRNLLSFIAIFTNNDTLLFV